VTVVSNKKKFLPVDPPSSTMIASIAYLAVIPSLINPQIPLNFSIRSYPLVPNHLRQY
jgi:hypothetical protein